MTRALLATLLLAVAVIAQIIIVNRLPLPWGAAPDLVVLVVTAIALRTSPIAGAVAGLAAGVVVGSAPPASHELGRYAIALCLAGYLTGALRTPVSSSALRPLGVAAAATAVTGLGFAFLGLALGDPRITFEAVASDFTTTLLLTMIVAPFVLYPSLRLLRGSREDGFTAIDGTSWARRGSLR